MDLEKPRSDTTWGLTAVLVSGQDFPSKARRYGGRISVAAVADDSITTHPLAFGLAQFPLAGVGLNCHPPLFFMDVYLHGWPAGVGPPGALFPGFHQSGQSLQHQLGTVVGDAT